MASCVTADWEQFVFSFSSVWLVRFVRPCNRCSLCGIAENDEITATPVVNALERAATVFLLPHFMPSIAKWPQDLQDLGYQRGFRGESLLGMNRWLARPVGENTARFLDNRLQSGRVPDAQDRIDH